MKRLAIVIFFLAAILQKSYSQTSNTGFINTKKVSAEQFGEDKTWYQENIPFFECSDQDIQNVYYYRWKLYKSHLKNLGQYGYIVTEFLNEMGWDLKPYSSLNDATAFHMYEGRWLKNTRYVRDYINFMYQKGGNDRHFSEGIADAAYAFYLVNPDKQFISSQLPAMIKIYNQWDDHFDKLKGLYYIEPLLDATEYTISSIDASGGKDGFRGGDAFRPSINSYMYANALAIRNIALLQNDTTTANAYLRKATAIKAEMQKSLWSANFQHFIDRYHVKNEYVTYWNPIRGRELVGLVPWAYNLPDDNASYAQAWQHILNTNELKGPYGLRTNEPSYPYYMKQYRYIQQTGERECQWNGPSWPFQNTQVLTGLANLLNNYHQKVITNKDYVTLLKQYALQHYMGNKLNIVEDYDPDKGGPIVNLNQRSEHYNHSGFTDLIITGLCGLRPEADNKLTINPLIANTSITYFCLQNVSYHGHSLTIIYDKTGSKYHQGKGVSVYLNGKRANKVTAQSKVTIQLPAPIIRQPGQNINMAVNLTGKGFPKASASFTNAADNVNMAIDGRLWYFTDVRNRWSCEGSNHATDWYQVAFEKAQSIKAASLCFYEDDKNLYAPQSYQLQYWNNNQWKNIPNVKQALAQPTGNTTNQVNFKPIVTDKIRVVFTNAGNNKYTALAELEVY